MRAVNFNATRRMRDNLCQTCWISPLFVQTIQYQFTIILPSVEPVAKLIEVNQCLASFEVMSSNLAMSDYAYRSTFRLHTLEHSTTQMILLETQDVTGRSENTRLFQSPCALIL